MSRWNDRDNTEQQRRREFENDVFYDAWRRGLNPDRATECAMDCYWEGRTPEQCVDGYEAQVRRQREQRRYEEEQEEMAYWHHQQHQGDME